MARNHKRWIISLYTVLIIIFFFNGNLLSQDNVTFIHMDKEDGLVGNSVSCILQDSFGFMIDQSFRP